MSYLDEPINAKGSSGAFTIPLGDSTLSNISPKPKEKKPFLRANTGLQTRLLRSREKK